MIGRSFARLVERIGPARRREQDAHAARQREALSISAGPIRPESGRSGETGGESSRRPSVSPRAVAFMPLAEQLVAAARSDWEHEMRELRAENAVLRARLAMARRAA